MPTNIEWVKNPDGTKGETWNFLAGCTKVSEGCAHCYALRMSWRIAHMPKHPPRYDGVVERGPDGLPRWTGLVNVDEWALNQPLRWRKPRRIFPCSMSDLFHGHVPDATIQRAWNVMAHCPQHLFLVLTKRADRMHDWINCHTSNGRPYMFVDRPGRLASDAAGNRIPWPLQNVVLMVTAENQRWADKRIPLLLDTPAAARGVSLEPLLGAVDLEAYLRNCTACYGKGYRIDKNLPCFYCEGKGRLVHGQPGYDKDKPALSHVIVGGESGPGARPMEVEWARSVKDQCQEAGVPFFLKQMMIDGKMVKMPELDGKAWQEYPDGWE